MIRLSLVHFLSPSISVLDFCSIKDKGQRPSYNQMLFPRKTQVSVDQTGMELSHDESYVERERERETNQV